MAIDMLVFDLRDNEKQFFQDNELQNFNFTFYKNSLNSDTVKEIPQDIKDRTTIISVFTDSDVTEDVINEFKNLRIISTRSTAYDHISKKAAIDRNIAVLNVSHYGETAVTQFTFCVIFALARNLLPAATETDLFHDADKWTGHDISQMTLGIVGTGSIGGAVCQVAQTLGMKVYGYDINIKQELIEKYGIEYLPFEELIRRSNIITLHLPYTGDNYHMFKEGHFDLMKKDSYFINTSSKKLVDLKGLYNALTRNKIKGAALDTTCCEELNSRCFAEGSSVNMCEEENNHLKLLAEMKNVIITPHIAYNTVESINYILQNTIDQIRETIKRGDVYGVY